MSVHCRGPKKVLAALALGVIALVGMAEAAVAAPYGGVEFPAGAASFADAVTNYAPVINGGEPVEANRVASRALAPPDCSDANDPDCFVSLGDGGSITLEFVDNRLTGSGNANQDLYIFEIGPQVEAMFVAVSADGQNFTDVGRVAGQPTGIDIDAFGFGPTSSLRFVRITDDPEEGGQSGASVGADIDAVGAISNAQAPTTTTTATGATTTTTATGATTTTTIAATTTSTTRVVTIPTSAAPPRVLATTGDSGKGSMALLAVAVIFAGLVLLAGRLLGDQHEDWANRL